MHRFFDSCANGYPEKINMERLDFSDIIVQVERRLYHCKVSVWLTKLVR